MKRKIDEALLSWKNDALSSRKPLVINGARQVGKTYSVLHFGASQFDDVLHVDFSAQPIMRDIFEGDIQPSSLIPALEAVSRKRINPANTLLFFDEIQACPRALTSLKYFCEQASEYHVIAAGSLLGVALGREEYSFPVGKVDQLHMYPLDFEEFLWATGDDALAELIRSSFIDNAKLVLHDAAMAAYQSYLLVGGMPEAVDAHIGGAAIERVRSLQQFILDGYIADMTKYASATDSARILNVWRAIPEQLAKENHKFQYSTIASSARAHQYETPVNWLNAAGLTYFCYRVSDGLRPLRAHVEHDFFKLYLLDCGLLTNLLGVESRDLTGPSEKSERLRGGIAENYVMQQLVAGGMQPYYWGTSSKAEVDFIIASETGDPVPIEVKSGKNVTAKSLLSYRTKYDPPYIVRISAKNFGFENGVRSVPLYAAFCL